MTVALPGALADIEAVAGRGAALAVSLGLGGQELYIPTPAWLAAHPDHDHPLRTYLGGKSLAELAERLGGGKVYVPLAARACAVHLAEMGISVSDIASRLHLATGTVRRYVRSG